MRLPLQITFRHVDPSPSVEDRIHEYAGELDRFFDQIMSCRVAVERQHRRHHQGNLFRVRLDITVPGREIVVGRESKPRRSHQDLGILIGQLFKAEAAALVDLDRARQRLGIAGEQAMHLLGRFEVAIGMALAAKTRDGALVRKRYHPPATPCQRLLADPRTNKEVGRRVHELRATLDPVRLLQQIRAVQQQLVDIADRPALGETAKPTSPTLEEFLLSLRTAWRDGEVRPTIIAKAKPKRSRRRPDPFAAVTTELREWFETEPWHTSRELLERLQAQYPGVYPEGQLRTLQRRLKDWRREAAHRMVFGTMTVDPCDASRDDEGRLLSNRANDHFSDRQGGAKSPVDLPLRLDDARASPTTPQGQHQ